MPHNNPTWIHAPFWRPPLVPSQDDISEHLSYHLRPRPFNPSNPFIPYNEAIFGLPDMLVHGQPSSAPSPSDSGGEIPLASPAGSVGHNEDVNPIAQDEGGLTGDTHTLVMDGDLDAMARGWSKAEYAAGRRLVRFLTRKEGNRLRVTFEPLHQEEWAQSKGIVCVSCIYHQQSDTCFVTSVDLLSLLASLIGVSFAVEDKNRIRRNLEGFKPTTISKHRLQTLDFFKKIMAFPQPQPRNIEKDVKVFSWDVLESALEKIIQKYADVIFFTGNGGDGSTTTTDDDDDDDDVASAVEAATPEFSPTETQYRLPEPVDGLKNCDPDTTLATINFTSSRPLSPLGAVSETLKRSPSFPEFSFQPEDTLLYPSLHDPNYKIEDDQVAEMEKYVDEKAFATYAYEDAPCKQVYNSDLHYPSKGEFAYPSYTLAHNPSSSLPGALLDYRKQVLPEYFKQDTPFNEGYMALYV